MRLMILVGCLFLTACSLSPKTYKADLPKRLITVSPQYPVEAYAKKQSGVVRVRFDISEAGMVVNPRIIYSHPYRLFDKAALEAMSQWRYEQNKPIKDRVMTLGFIMPGPMPHTADPTRLRLRLSGQ